MADDDPPSFLLEDEGRFPLEAGMTEEEDAVLTEDDEAIFWLELDSTFLHELEAGATEEEDVVLTEEEETAF